MKAVIQKILKAVLSRSGKALFRKDNKQHKSTAFEPAPSYWALIPIKVETRMPSKKGRD